MPQYSSSLPESYPGYPTQRFTLEASDYSSLNGIEIPDGPWVLNNSPLPTHEQIVRFTEMGLAVDSIGRPLHPWADTLLSNEVGGVVVGKGRYWNWGPNKTADPIVITEEARPRLLLITRSDTGALALPGGFVDQAEDPYSAAIRELAEESGLEGVDNGQLIYNGPVADLRTTLNAWAETSAYLFSADTAVEVKGNDDALAADWYYIDELPDTLFGSHAMLVERALEYKRSRQKVATVLTASKEERIITEIQAGHMAYRHYTAAHNNATIFVKEHDAQQFTDPLREAHSRAYLVKENTIYEHLRLHKFTSIPREFRLLDDTLLALSHLSKEAGWLWYAPKENTENYIQDVLSSFSKLQAISPMNTDSAQFVAESYQTFWREGWDAIDNNAIKKITHRIDTLTQNWHPVHKSDAMQLVDYLEVLGVQSSVVDRNPEMFFSHNDARQSNIAWHPEKGTRIVDWSWADIAPKNGDATMFIIDLAKSGHNVEPYKSNFNHEYALTLIGFWLAHSTWETRDSNTEVREHQIASASVALQLLRSWRYIT